MTPQKLLRILVALNFFLILDFVILMPLGPQVMKELNISPGAFGWVVSSYTIAASLAGLVSSVWIDGFNRRTAILVVFAIFIIATFLCGLAPGYGILLGGRFAAGFAGGILSGLLVAVVSELFAFEQRGAAMGKLMSAFSMASVVGIPAGLYLAGFSGWRTPFLATAGLALVPFYFVFQKFPPMDAHLTSNQSHSHRSLGKILQHWWNLARVPAHFWALVLTFFTMSSHFLMVPLLSTFLTQNLGLSQTQLPMVYLVGGVATFLSSQWIGKLSDRFGKKRVFLVVAMCASPILLLTAHLPMGVTPTQIILCTTVFMVLVSGRMVPAVTLISGSVSAESRGSFMGLQNFVQHAAQSIAAAAGGAIVLTSQSGRLENFEWTGIVAFVLNVLAIMATSRMRETNR
jgi:predicted MFS family arabinose efflux permease